MLDYLIFGTVLRGKAKKGLCGNVMQPATKGAALGQPQEMPLWGWHGYRACGLHKDAESPTWGRLQRKLINARRADCPSLMNLEKEWLVEKETVICEHIYMGCGK